MKVKKESDASGKVYEQGSEAQATSDSKINIADVLNLVKQNASEILTKQGEAGISDRIPENNMTEYIAFFTRYTQTHERKTQAAETGGNGLQNQRSVLRIGQDHGKDTTRQGRD